MLMRTKAFVITILTYRCHAGKYIEDIHIFGMNMTFISSSKAKIFYYIQSNEIQKNID